MKGEIIVKEQYVEPVVELVVFDAADIITASGCGTCDSETIEICTFVTP